jgi:hypothetical protein
VLAGTLPNTPLTSIVLAFAVEAAVVKVATPTRAATVFFMKLVSIIDSIIPYAQRK